MSDIGALKNVASQKHTAALSLQRILISFRRDPTSCGEGGKGAVMPILQYKCEKCGKKFEELVQKFDDPVLCPDCKAPAVRDWSGEMFSSTGKKPSKCSGNCKTCGGCH